MYKEVLDYIRDLGKERALPEKDRQKERQEEVCECMNMIADEICRIYGSYKRYMINEKAFDYAESYIQIYEPSRKN